MPDWEGLLEKSKSELQGKDTARDMAAYLNANVEVVKATLGGCGPDDHIPHPDAGARAVANISASHIPAFCQSGYKNGYDLGKYALGDTAKRRVLVDSCLPIADGDYEKVYFVAAELNGAGIRFYGDFCLVLKADAVSSKTDILERNSYDLIRPPASTEVAKVPDSLQVEKRKDIAREWHGTWEADLPAMGAIKVLQARVAGNRRLTAGQVSDGLLEDEDYIEVLKKGSFTAGDLQEVRVSAADASLDEHLARRLRSGPVPRMVELLWLVRRRKAEQALRKKQLTVRVVTTSGRVR